VGKFAATFFHESELLFLEKCPSQVDACKRNFIEGQKREKRGEVIDT